MKKNESIIKVFTDGSYKYIPYSDTYYCGYGIHFINIEIKDISKKFKIYPLTNQRAELYAIYKTIKIITKSYNFDILEIYTDSEYSIKSLTEWIHKWKVNEWKTSNNKKVLNTDIIKKIDKYMQKYSDKIKLIHVKAHTKNNDFNSTHNAIADQLARYAK